MRITVFRGVFLYLSQGSGHSDEAPSEPAGAADEDGGFEAAGHLFETGGIVGFGVPSLSTEEVKLLR